MSTLFFTKLNRCFGTARNITITPNFRTVLISQLRMPIKEKVSQKIHTRALCYNRIILQQSSFKNGSQIRKISTETPSDKPEEKKQSLYQRFKTMYKDYWYVLVPVHLFTSACWYGGFYYMAKSGVDIVALLESLSVSEKLIQPLREGHSTTGYLALAYALYKLSTPLRYTVTLGGTTVSINYLKHWGYIKPMPSKEQLKVLYKERRETLEGKRRELQNTFQGKRQEIKDTFQEKTQEIKDNVIKKLKDIDGSKKKS